MCKTGKWAVLSYVCLKRGESGVYIREISCVFMRVSSARGIRCAYPGTQLCFPACIVSAGNQVCISGKSAVFSCVYRQRGESGVDICEVSSVFLRGASARGIRCGYLRKKLCFPA